MAKISTHIRRKALELAVALVVLAISTQSFGQVMVQGLHDRERELFNLINEARIAPLAMAAKLNMDPEKVLADLPELKDILINGLPPLSENEQLAAAASGHTNDMVENAFYSHTSSSGADLAERILMTGYIPASEAETLGLAAFTNYLDPAYAVSIIFENMFRDELNPNRKEERAILSPSFEDLAVSIGAGVFELGYNYQNAYVATCVFARSKTGSLENQLLDLVNNVRKDPRAWLEDNGVDTKKLLEETPSLDALLSEGAPPLTMDEALKTAARLDSSDMAENNFLGNDSSDGTGYKTRLRLHLGRLPVETGETVYGIEQSFSDDPAKLLPVIVRQLILDEVNDIAAGGSAILLNRVLRMAGIGIASAISGTSDISLRSLKITCDLTSLDYLDVSPSFLLWSNPPPGSPWQPPVTGPEFDPLPPGSPWSPPIEPPYEGSFEEQIGIELKRLIDLARENPLDMAEEMGLDPDELLLILPEMTPILLDGVSGLIEDTTLFDTAYSQARDIMKYGYFSTESLDGLGASDRISDAGRGELTNGIETIGSVATTAAAEAGSLARVLFEARFKDELNPGYEGVRVILGADLNLSGVMVASKALDEEGLAGGKYYLWVMDAATGGTDLASNANQGMSIAVESLTSSGLRRSWMARLLLRWGDDGGEERSLADFRDVKKRPSRVENGLDNRQRLVY